MRAGAAVGLSAIALVGGILLGGLAVGGLGVAVGYALFADDEPATGLPEAVEDTRVALLEATETGDYEALQPHLPPEFEYTFGGAVKGGPIAYWQQLERTTDERPLEALSAILKMPYVLSRGYYVWPWAYTVESADDLSAHERELLTRLGPVDRLVFEGTGYLGWRAGFEPDGTWAFFVAGD